MGMVGEACLPSNAYYPRTPDYTLFSGVHVCWSEQSDSSFVYGFMNLDYGLDITTLEEALCAGKSAGSHENSPIMIKYVKTINNQVSRIPLSLRRILRNVYQLYWILRLRKAQIGHMF